jgi:hypothetical protein
MKRLDYLKEQVEQGYLDLIKLINDNKSMDEIVEFEKIVSNRFHNYKLEIRLNEIRKKKKNENIT